MRACVCVFMQLCEIVIVESSLVSGIPEGCVYMYCFTRLVK